MFYEPTPRFHIVRVQHEDAPSGDGWAFRMLDDAREHTLAHAMVLATGDDGAWRVLLDSDRLVSELHRPFAGWGDALPDTRTGWLGNGFVVSTSMSERARVGEPVVQVVGCPATPSRGALRWWDDLIPLEPTMFQGTFDDEFGFVTRHADPWHACGSAPIGSPLATLFARLSVADRVALESHLTLAGLLTPAPLSSEDLATLAMPFGVLGDLIGHGHPQGPGGGLPAGIHDDLSTTLAWPRQETARHVGAAWRVRCLRRLRGDVLRTNRGRLEDRRSRRDLVAAVVGKGATTAGAALALVAIADGLGEHLSDIPVLLSEPRRAIRPRSIADGPIISDRDAVWETPVIEDTAQTESSALLDALSLFSSRDAFGAITPEMRRLARHLMLQEDRYSWF